MSAPRVTTTFLGLLGQYAYNATTGTFSNGSDTLHLIKNEREEWAFGRSGGATCPKLAYDEVTSIGAGDVHEDGSFASGAGTVRWLRPSADRTVVECADLPDVPPPPPPPPPGG